MKVQLHWCEFVQGKWTQPISTDLTRSEALDVLDDFDARGVHLHVSKEVDASGVEGALKVHVDFPAIYDEIYMLLFLVAAFSGIDPNTIQRTNHTFRITSKNCAPDFSSAYYESAPEMPYNQTGVDATRYTGSSTLSVSFQSQIQSNGTSTTEHENILNTVQNFELLNCANPVVPPFLSPSEADYWEAGSLVSPFFFKDTSNPGAGNQTAFLDERTFFVQPSFTETVVVEWDGWAVGPSRPPQFALDPNLFDKINVVAQVPAAGPVPVNPGDPAYSLIPMQDLTDWATSSGVAISYKGTAVGKNGGINTGRPGSLPASASGSGVVPVALNGAFRALTLVGEQGIGANQLQAIQASKAALPAASTNLNRTNLPTRG